MSFVYSLEMLGTAAFAVSGALAASRKRMDIFGFCVLALLPAVGGGTIRDIIIDRVPVFWVSDNRYVAVAIIAALVVFFAPVLRALSKTRHQTEIVNLGRRAGARPVCRIGDRDLPAAQHGATRRRDAGCNHRSNRRHDSRRHL
jgi:hypothetical protein